MQHNTLSYFFIFIAENSFKLCDSKQEGKMIYIDAFITPYFPETEAQFDRSNVVLIDVLRACTTICTALENGALEIIPAESLEKAINKYSFLDKEKTILAGERNASKPNGFDLGNSPFEYDEKIVSGKKIIFTTTNGTKLFKKAQKSKNRIIGSLVNIDAVIDFLGQDISDNLDQGKDTKVNFMCAGTDGNFSYEDTLCAGAFISKMHEMHNNIKITDTAHAALTLYESNKSDLAGFIKTTRHAKKLKELEHEKDIDFALEFNKFKIVPLIKDQSIIKSETEKT